MVKIKTNCFKLSETRIRLGMSVNGLSKAEPWKVIELMLCPF